MVRDETLGHTISQWNYLDMVHMECASVHESGC